jgi:urate oxidase
VAIVLGSNRYGKAETRLVRLTRGGDTHGLIDLNVCIALTGDLTATHLHGDNAGVLPTDTMKNTVYAFARNDDLAHVERFAERLATHFVEQPSVTRARISATEHPWQRVLVAGRPHPHAFLQPAGEQWTALVTCDGEGTHLSSGVTNLVLLKTTDSAFADFARDQFTTLAETTDRILATAVTASWRYRTGMRDFPVRDRIRQALIETFATHASRSVQHTLYAMAERALDVCAEVTEITMSLPNRHHLLVDLKPFGLDNPNEVFVATDQPYGLIEATVSRKSP